MTSWKKAIAPGLALVLLTAGCSSASEPETSTDSGTSSPTSSSTAAVSPSPAEASTTVEQWASKIAEQRNAYDDVQGDWDDATCSSLAASDGAIDCQIMMGTMGLTAETAAISIGALKKADSRVYIGEPPPEIAALVDETITTAQAAADATVDIACFEDDCIGESFEAERAWNALGDKYAAWEPYL